MKHKKCELFGPLAVIAQEKQLDRQPILSDTSEDKNWISPSIKPEESECYQGAKVRQISEKGQDLTDTEVV